MERKRREMEYLAFLAFGDLTIGLALPFDLVSTR